MPLVTIFRQKNKGFDIVELLHCKAKHRFNLRPMNVRLVTKFASLNICFYSHYNLSWLEIS